MRSDFVAFILTHGRADSVITDKTLRKCGYTGPIVYVIDNEDKAAADYYAKYKNVIMFDKPKIAKTFDEADNFDDRRAIVYARNACFQIARKLGYKYFIELDDDYDVFSFTYGRDGTVKQRAIKQLDVVFEAMLRFYESIPALTLAMAQRGDFVGGKENDILKGEKMKRKAMNSFICSVDRPFQFVGRINEDVNTYTTLGSRGCLLLQVPQVALNQKQTQKNKGGMTDIYMSQGTYVKSFYTVMMMPSSVKVGVMGHSEETKRLHHVINWNNTVPKILDERFKKNKMAAPTGNKFWMLRSKHGRDKLFSTPELLWEAACEYFQWCDENPWLSKKAIQKTVPVRRKKGKKVETVNEQQVQQEVSPTSRPYSLTGFCIYVGASSKWWSTFRTECRNKNDEDFLEVIARVEETIETQQFEGACVGAFNANIIARKLGLADKQEVDHTNAGKEFKGFNFLPYTEDAEKVK